MAEDLFFPNLEPLARNADLRTSHEAAKALTLSGKRSGQKRTALDGVMRWPGLTASELAQRLGGGEWVHKRLPDLRRDGFVVNGAPRDCTVTGRKAVTWEVSDVRTTAGPRR